MGSTSSSSSQSQFPYAGMAGMEQAGVLSTMGTDMYKNLVLDQMMPLFFNIGQGGQALQTPYVPGGWGGDWQNQAPGVTSPYAGTPGSQGNYSGQGTTGGNNPMGNQVNPLGGGNFAQFGAPGMIMQQAFDPQNAMYNLASSQTADQTNSALAQSGMANSPLGAATMGNTMGNFNIGYQNNQLSREQQGLSSAMNAYTSALGGASTAVQPISSAASADASIAGIQKSQSNSTSMSNPLSGMGGMMGK